MIYPIKRDLDNIYFRVQRGNQWEAICFTDLTEKEKDEILKDKNEQWLKSMVKELANNLRNIGDQLNLKTEKERKD